MKTILATTAAAALFAGGAFAQDDMDMSASAYDTNQDRQISQDEFQTGMEDAWRRHAGDDGVMSEEEFTEAGFGDEESFAEFDANEDDMLDENEFSEGVFAEYDADEDEMWSEEETAEYDDWWEENQSAAN